VVTVDIVAFQSESAIKAAALCGSSFAPLSQPLITQHTLSRFRSAHMTRNWEPGVQYNFGDSVEYMGAVVIDSLLLVDFANEETLLRQSLQHHSTSSFAG